MNLMKTFYLSLPLLCCAAYGAEQDIDSNTPDRWQFTGDTTARLTNDLTYEGIVREDSNGYSSPLGAVFHSTGALVLTSEDRYALTFDRNTKNTAGGMIYANGDLTFEQLGNLTFTGNSAATTTGSAVKTGIVACSGSGSITFSDVGDILIEGNTSSNGRGLGFITSYSRNVLFEDTGNITFKNNLGSTGSSAMVYSRDGRSTGEFGVVFRKTGNVSFENNTAQGIYSISGALLSGIDQVRFVNSSGAQDGGAIFSRSFAGDKVSVAIVDCGDVLFEGNKSRARGGAIEVELMNDDNTERSIVLSADRGDIVFKGNLHENDTTLGFSNPVANSIYINVNGSNYQPSVFGTLDLRAQEGREISFYDPIMTGQFATGHAKAQTGVTVIDFNKTADASDPVTAEYGGNAPSRYNGTIRFSGKETASYIVKDQNSSESASAYQARLEQSRYSDVIARTTLHDGELIIEQDAVFGHKNLSTLKSKGMESSLSVTKGLLDLNTRGVINACNVEFSGANAIVRADGSGTINALSASMNQGIGVDLGYYIAGGQASDHAGLKISSTTFSLGGNVTIHDDAAGFYASDIWADDQTFTLFTLTKSSGGVFGSFDGIESFLAGSDTVTGSGYQGIWSLSETVSGNTKTIRAHWTVTATPIPEPGAAALAFSACLALLLRRHKKTS